MSFPQENQEIYKPSLKRFGNLQHIENSDSGTGYLYPNWKEMKFPIAFVRNRATGKLGIAIKILHRIPTYLSCRAMATLLNFINGQDPDFALDIPADRGPGCTPKATLPE